MRQLLQEPAILSTPRRKGFDSLLTERGTNLSGGQRQRIELARALITAPDVLIPDDTTSAADAVTEAEINTALGRYADEGHMLLVIARRRSTPSASQPGCGAIRAVWWIPEPRQNLKRAVRRSAH